ncbi:MAG: MBL fold metallo-hydrolase [Betaproteobacteria bacterium]|nr:MBL fold metallo-hydrolase [Betaproteobacteria bacterium]
MKLTFLGAAGEVTGSCYLVETERARFLVDCGMFQGGQDAARKNRQAFDFDPGSLEFVTLTHAHIDHSGLLPRLCAQGFRGPVYATAATCDLLSVMLPDAAHIQEKEAEHANYTRRRERRRAARDTAPLYTVAQAQSALGRLRPLAYEQDFEAASGVRLHFRDAGHILGSASIELRAGTGARARSVVFSGDLGQPGHPIVRDPAPVPEADVLLVESTYGNRLHKGMPETLGELTHAIIDTLGRKGGNVIVPAFSVGRTQDLLFLLADLTRQGRLPELDIYVDSPMAAAATEITLKHRELFDPEAAATLRWFAKRNGPPRVNFVEDVAESIRLNDLKGGALIISASGMCDAGRIKYHLKYNLGRPECTVLITGFQAAGTLGRRLVDGAKLVKIFGQEIPVRADIYTIGGLSAHADQAGLLHWLKQFRRAPEHTYVVHGESGNAMALAEKIRAELGWRATLPERGESVTA